MNFAIRTFLLLAMSSVIAKAQDPTTLVCGDDEELFQIRISPGKYGAGPFSYRVITESTNEIHDECIDCGREMTSAYVRVLCLPKDGCHTALVGRWVGRWVSCDMMIELVVSWGGQTLRKNNAWLFDRIDFGDGCPNDPVCDTDDEILFEFFRDSNDPIRNPISWALTDMMNSENQSALIEGHSGDQESFFIYEAACVPRTSCLEFNILGLNDPENDYDASMYSVRLDGVIYSEYELRFGGSEGIMNRTILLGNNCTVETACNATDEDLFATEFEFFAPDDSYCAETSAIFEHILVLKKDNETDYRNYHIWTGVYEDFEVNQPYAFMTCIPKDECAKFSWQTDSPTTYYKLFQNGEELTQRIVHTDEDDPEKGLTTTDVGICAGAGKLSLVQGIAVSSTLSVLALFVALL